MFEFEFYCLIEWADNRVTLYSYDNTILEDEFVGDNNIRSVVVSEFEPPADNLSNS